MRHDNECGIEIEAAVAVLFSASSVGLRRLSCAVVTRQDVCLSVATRVARVLLECVRGASVTPQSPERVRSDAYAHSLHAAGCRAPSRGRVRDLVTSLCGGASIGCCTASREYHRWRAQIGRICSASSRSSSSMMSTVGTTCARSYRASAGCVTNRPASRRWRLSAT